MMLMLQKDELNERTEKQGADEEACEMTMMMIKIMMRHPCDQVRISFRFGFVSQQQHTHTQHERTNNLYLLEMFTCNFTFLSKVFIN
jgi:hypothetical protein